MRAADYERLALGGLRHMLMEPGGQAENLKRPRALSGPHNPEAGSILRGRC
jgi:hypothetical protein